MIQNDALKKKKSQKAAWYIKEILSVTHFFSHKLNDNTIFEVLPSLTSSGKKVNLSWHTVVLFQILWSLFNFVLSSSHQGVPLMNWNSNTKLSAFSKWKCNAFTVSEDIHHTTICIDLSVTNRSKNYWFVSVRCSDYANFSIYNLI